MTDFVSLRADGRRIDFSTSSHDAAKIADWDWANPTQAPTMTSGVDGGVPVPGTSALDGDRSPWLEVRSTYGNVTGDADGLAINRAADDDGSAWTTATGSGTLTVSRALDLTGLSESTVEAGCELSCSTTATVTVELVRGSTVVSSATRVVPAGEVVTFREQALTITGSGSGTIRAKVMSAPASTTLSMRRVLVGVGLDGIYHDQYTPGAKQVGGRAVRTASGTIWANSFLAAIDRAVGAVRRGGAVLRRSGDGFNEAWWELDVNSADYSAPQKGDHQRGHAEAKISTKTQQLARLAPRELAGHTTTVGGMPVFVADEPVPGSDDALGDITVTWNGSRRDARISVCESLPMLWSGTAAIPSWSSVSADDSFGTTVLSGSLPVIAPTNVASYTSTFTGRARFQQRIAVETATTADLIINGRRVASADVVADPFVQDGKWRFADFLVHSVEAGDKVSLAIQSPGGGDGWVDRMVVTPDEFTSAFMTVGDPMLPSSEAAGDDFRPGLSSADLDGAAALLGGTWNAPGWRYYTIGFAQRLSSGATNNAELSTTKTLTADSHISLDFRAMSFDSSFGPSAIGLYATSGSRAIVITTDNASVARIKVYVDDGGGTAYELYTSIESRYLDVIDGRIQVDGAGRVTFFAAAGGTKLRVIGSVHIPELAGGTYKARASTFSFNRFSIYSMRILSGDNPYDDEVRWARDATDRLVEGRLPRLRAGSTPYVFAHAAFTAADSPIDANVHPTDYSVTITPRVLTVPD